MVILRLFRWSLLLAVFLCLLLYVSLEGVCLYTLSKLDPAPITTPVHSPPEALDLLWVSLGERGEIKNFSYSVATFPFFAYKLKEDDVPSGVRSSFLIAMQQLGKSKKRVLGWHADSFLLSSWHSQHSQARPRLQYLLDNSHYFGGRIYGADDAARVFFGKRASSLNLSEWTTLVALLKSPNAYHPIQHRERLQQRSAWLFEQLQHNWPEKYQGESFVFPELSNLGRDQETARNHP